MFGNEFPKNDVKRVLLHEQHGICAYCMKRIRMDNHSRVELLVPLSKSKDNAIDYNNMLGVCDGGERITGKGKLYIQTGKKKEVSKQIHENPKVEICAFKNGEWLRLAGELAADDRREARQSMLDAYPSLQRMYSADDGNTEVFYFRNATASFSSFTHEPEIVEF